MHVTHVTRVTRVTIAVTHVQAVALIHGVFGLKVEYPLTNCGL